MNFIAALEVASDAAGRQNIGTTLADIKSLYGVYQQIVAAKKLDIPAMEKAGTLKPAIEALARTSALVVAMQADKDAAPHVAALLEAL